uniref:Rab-like protein 3 n=1 Tax=Strigamia maritima TaxID=126957 RepID=T1IUH3_STRMM
MSSSSIDKVKIIVVGDSGVGKSSLVHLICHGEHITNPSWTIGCSVEVKLHEYKEGTPMEKNYFVELWDVGGSNSHRNSRSIFYNLVHGILLVHDLTNRKSQQNLRKWLAEILNKESNSKSKHDTYDYDPEQYVDSQIPILVVGTKQDLAQVVRSNAGAAVRSSPFAEECGADEIHLNCQQAKALAPGSSNAVKLSRFFDKVIENRFPRESHMAASFLDRRRLFIPNSKMSHND